MTASSAVEVFTEATSALVREHDVTDVLLGLIRGGTRLLSAAAIGVVVRTDAQTLELLSATSHRAAELEIFQGMQQEGPCVECVHTGQPVTAVGASELRLRWQQVGPTILAAGFQAVHAQPLRWRGQILGGLNTFWQEATTIQAEQQRLAQALGDMATLVLIQAAEINLAQVDQRISHALRGRVTIERAKGVLAYSRGVDMATAYDELMKLADRNGATVTATAHLLIQRAGTSDGR